MREQKELLRAKNSEHESKKKQYIEKGLDLKQQNDKL